MPFWTEAQPLRRRRRQRRPLRPSLHGAGMHGTTYRNHPQCRGSRLLQKAEAVGVVEQCALWKAVVNGSLPLESFLSMAGEETKVGWTTFGEAMRELEALPEEERRVEEGRLVEMGRGLASELC
mmetsp:Transcript_4295/g.6564  ORF Transcript_4295/g.6564 Transcript_4295/m.6564 type:complete len:124 (+) Transcript_4295:2-373(+)